MAAELQQLLEKIQHDGVEKANAEAAAIRAQAQKDAAVCLKDAEDRAAALRTQAETDAQAFAARANETVRQAARDVILEVKDGLTALLTNLLAKNVQAALADPAKAADLTATVLAGLVKDDAADVHAGATLAATLQAQFAAQAKTGVKVVTDDTVGAGFTVRLDNGRVEHDFSEQALAAALARRLRPDLAKLVQG